MNSTQKQYLIIGIAIAVLATFGIYFFLNSNTSNKSAEEKESVFEQPAELIPAVDSSVTASLTGKKEGSLELQGIPDGTDSVEYELTYDTKSGSIEGVFGKIDVGGESTAQEKITFGTCSSGVCRYHDIVGEVNGVFKFSGDYGKKLLEKSFDLN